MAGPVQIVGEERVITNFQRLHAETRKRLAGAVYESGAMLQRHIQNRKLSGQALNVRTGRLRSSIALSPPTAARDDGKRISIMVGTNVKYGVAWELGLSDHPIAARRRKFLRFTGRDGKWVFRRSVNWRTRIHKRSFLGSAFVEMQAAIRAKLMGAAARRGGGG